MADQDELIFQLYGIDEKTEMPKTRQSVSSTDQQIMDLYGVREEPSQGPVKDFVAGVATIPRGITNLASEALTGKPKFAPSPSRDSVGFKAGKAFSDATIAGTAMGITGGRVNAAPRGFASGNALERTENAVRGFARDVGTTFRRNPVKISLAEGAMGSAASLGGSYASQKYPGSPEARAVGELIGGFTPMGAGLAAQAGFSLGTRLPGLSWAIKQANETYANINLSGTRRRVSNRLDRATGNREGAILGLSEELSPGARELMSPAMRTDSDGLMALEKAVFNAVDGGKASEEFIQSYRAINDAIIADIRQSSTAPNLNAGQNRLQKELSNIGLFVDERIRLAGQFADEKISKSLVDLDNEQISGIVRGQLDTALKEARQVESSYWGLVPDGVRVPTSNASKAFLEMKSGLGKPSLKDLPRAARRWLNPKSDGYKKNFFKEASIKDMRSLYSELRSEARGARAGDSPNFNLARMSDEIADAVLKDMNQSLNNPEMDGYAPLQLAINYSRQLNQKFGSGAVGRVLRMGRDSGEVIPKNLTLQNTLGNGGPKSGEVIDRMLVATDNNPETRTALANYTRNLFLKSVRHGEGPINTTTGRTFMRNNEATLKRFPELRKEFTDALEAQDAATVASKVLPKSASHFDIATMYINQSPDKAWTQILGARNSASSTRRLMSLAKQDESGVALEQLRESFLEHVISNSKTSDGFIDGQKLGDLLTTRSFREAESELLTREQRARWDRVLRTSQRLGLRNTKSAGEGVLGDKPGMFNSVIARLLGGSVGREAAKAGVGGSIQTVQTFSNAFSKLASAGVLDPPRQLIIDAVMAKDDELFKSLLDVRPNLPMPPKVKQRINAWVGMTLYNLGNEE